jgi:nitrite reductase (NADH) large subunit
MHFVIAGGGVAGITAAMDLARRDLGEVDVYSDEAYPYYYRPMLTEFLAGNVPMERLVRHDLDWYAGRGIHVHLETPIAALDPEARAVTLTGGERVPYDRLLLALGSRPFVPPIEGADKDRVYTWRTLADTLEIEQAADVCAHTLVIGGGLLGLEAARGLQGFCPNVTVLEYFPRLMPRQLDTEGAAVLQRFVESLGIEVMVGAHTQQFLGDEAVQGVRLEGGQEIPGQTVVVAAGVRANAAVPQAAGLLVDRGVVVDEHMATSAPDVYAAGDLAVYKGYAWAIAPIAQAQARIAAANMAGEDAVYDVVVPSTTLKVVGIDVSSVGLINPQEEGYVEVRHQDDDAGTYKKIVLHDGRIVGSIVIGDRKLARALEQKIADRTLMTSDAARKLLTA